MKHCYGHFTCFFIALYVNTASAAWYQVEVIVFDQLFPDFDSELWYENPGLPDRSNSIELIEEMAEAIEASVGGDEDKKQAREIPPERTELTPYLQLGPEELKLEGVQRVLKLSREYRPLMHVAWQQPGLTLNNARAVHLQKFEEIDELSAEEMLAQEPDSIESLGASSTEEDDFYQVLDLVFDGTIRLRSSRFLHVDVDIAYFPKFLAEENAKPVAGKVMFVQQQADYVRLQESRKIKLNEIHYFDHPIFGVIMRVSRLKRR